MIIYKATNVINDDSYIGLTTTSLKKRISSHLSSKDGSYFHRALNKYGVDVFQWSVLYETDSRDILISKEIYYIEKYNTFFGDGYNMTTGGEGTHGVCGENHWLYGKGELSHFYGKSPSKETRQKISNSNKGKMMGEGNPMYGKKHTDEAKIKISNIQKERMSGEGNPMYGKKHTDEAKIKIGNAQRGKSCVKKTYKITLPQGDIVYIKGLEKFCKEHKLVYSSVHAYIKRKKSYKGYFVEDTDI